MDLSFQTIHDVVHPTAAFVPDTPGPGDLGTSVLDHHKLNEAEQWEKSVLNPKNLIDSLDPPLAPMWRIDGCTGLGTQLYAIPLFLPAALPPMRIDVFISEGASFPEHLRRLLGLDALFHTKDPTRVARLAISNHILRILQHHTVASNGDLRPDAIKNLWWEGPFGSKIVIDNLGYIVGASKVTICPNYALEQELLSIKDLASYWDVPESSLPQELDVLDLVFVKQIHDSVCVVAKRADTASTPVHWIFKSLTSDTRYLYHELKMLLFEVPYHPNIIQKPRHLVTKDCLFGGKKGVLGFLLEYHPRGSIRDTLPLLRIHGQLNAADQLRWSLQLAEAINSLWMRGIYYPDLRLDNIVTTEQSDIVMVDFEQRGVWVGFGSPMSDAFECAKLLACDDPDSPFAISDSHIEEYRKLLDKHYPGGDAWQELTNAYQYENPPLGYNVAWHCLSREEQEASMAYMLGRVFWCIWEGESAPQAGAMWQSYNREPEIEFPNFLRTPPLVQDLINQCIGSGQKPKHHGAQIYRRNSKLFVKVGGTEVVDAEGVRLAAKELWTEELHADMDWIDQPRVRANKLRDMASLSLEDIQAQLNAMVAVIQHTHRLEAPPGLALR